jgi:hypothetical protein
MSQTAFRFYPHHFRLVALRAVHLMFNLPFYKDRFGDDRQSIFIAKLNWLIDARILLASVQLFIQRCKNTEIVRLSDKIAQ